MKELLKMGIIKEIGSQSELLAVGSSLESFIYVIEGEIKVYLSGPDGKRKTLYWIKNNESCMLAVNCLINSELYPANAKTTQDSKLLFIDNSNFQKLMQKDSFRNLVFKMQTTRLKETLNLLKNETFRNLDHRVASYILKREENNYLKVTHTIAAEDIGSSRERVSKSFKKLESLNLINKKETGAYKVYVQKIKKYLSM